MPEIKFAPPKTEAEWAKEMRRVLAEISRDVREWAQAINELDFRSARRKAGK